MNTVQKTNSRKVESKRKMRPNECKMRLKVGSFLKGKCVQMDLAF